MRVVLEVKPPFRLDLTVMALPRLPKYPIGVLDGATWVRAFATPAGPVVWEIAQADDRHVEIELHGPAHGTARWKALAARVLATDVDLTDFYRRARRIPRVAELVDEFRGLKPPRFADLTETLLATVPFQQLSLQAAMTITRRLVERTANAVRFRDLELHPVPDPGRIASTPEAELRALGFSLAKARTLRSLAAQIVAGELTEDELEPLPTDEAMRRLEARRGIGAWTAGLILLRGFRRLDVFPGGDVGAANGLRALLGDADPGPVLDALGPWRGMLYYHLLLARLRGAPAPTDPTSSGGATR